MENKKIFKSRLSLCAYTLFWLMLLFEIIIIFSCVYLSALNGKLIICQIIAALIALFISFAWQNISVWIEDGKLIFKRLGIAYKSIELKDYIFIPKLINIKINGGHIYTVRKIIAKNKQGKKKKLTCYNFSEDDFIDLCMTLNKIEVHTETCCIEENQDEAIDSMAKNQFNIPKRELLKHSKKFSSCIAAILTVSGILFALYLCVTAWDSGGFEYFGIGESILTFILSIIFFSLFYIPFKIAYKSKKKKTPSNISVYTDGFSVDKEIYKEKDVIEVKMISDNSKNSRSLIVKTVGKQKKYYLGNEESRSQNNYVLEDYTDLRFALQELFKNNSNKFIFE